MTRPAWPRNLLGYGISTSQKCNDGTGSYPSTTWNGKYVIDLLGQMATGPIKGGGNTCNATENSDGDHFYCQPTGTDLSSVFAAAAVQLAGGSKLVQLYPIPLVTSVSPGTGSAAGGTTVAIGGQFFTGATTVRFGGTAATFTVASDSQITATAPPGVSGTTVDITVSTGGGISPIVSTDRYTYGP